MSKTRNMTKADLHAQGGGDYFGSFLLNSMSTQEGDLEAVIEHPNWSDKSHEPFIEVVLTMNGVEVDGVKWAKFVVSQFDSAVQRKAAELISDTKEQFLQGLRDRFETIEDALDTFVEDFERQEAIR